MKIRSITCFICPSLPSAVRTLAAAGALAQDLRLGFISAGYEVQTTRLATTPFAEWAADLDADALTAAVRQMEAAAAEAGFAYVSFGPALPEAPQSYAKIPALLSATQNAFFSAMLTTPGGVSLPAVRACAEIIHQAAAITPDGFTNLRFAALANVPAGAPFFPAAYHAGTRPAAALALESADLAVEAFGDPQDGLTAARRRLQENIERHAHALNAIGSQLAARHDADWRGIDFSLAPFPAPDRSLGAALERLGAPAAGLHGSLAAAAVLTDTVDQARFVRTGFNGLFLPVLEDSTLAARAAEGTLTITDLLLCAAVCGTGIDTVPLPGDTPPEAIAPLLLDLAALALRLDKPLTARLMPILGKAAGDPTQFDFAFFANSRVMSLRAAPVQAFFCSDEIVPIAPRRRGGL
jgi:hypothetical protein